MQFESWPAMWDPSYGAFILEYALMGYIYVTNVFGLQGQFAVVKATLLLCHLESRWNTIYDANHNGWLFLDR